MWLGVPAQLGIQEVSASKEEEVWYAAHLYISVHTACPEFDANIDEGLLRPHFFITEGLQPTGMAKQVIDNGNKSTLGENS